MPPTNEEIKAALLARYEQQLDKMLAEYQAKGEDITLTDIENIALKMGDQTSQTITAELVSQPRDEQIVPGPICEQCGEEMQYKGKKPKKVQTRSGEVTVKRRYYYCARCQRGFFPPG